MLEQQFLTGCTNGGNRSRSSPPLALIGLTMSKSPFDVLTRILISIAKGEGQAPQWNLHCLRGSVASFLVEGIQI